MSLWGIFKSQTMTQFSGKFVNGARGDRGGEGGEKEHRVTFVSYSLRLLCPGSSWLFRNRGFPPARMPLLALTRSWNSLCRCESSWGKKNSLGIKAHCLLLLTRKRLVFYMFFNLRSSPLLRPHLWSTCVIFDWGTDFLFVHTSPLQTLLWRPGFAPWWMLSC